MRPYSVGRVAAQLLLLGQTDADNSARCIPDKCAAIVAARFWGPQHSAGCSSFQSCTVIPATKTVTLTSSVTPVPVTQTDLSIIPITVTATQSTTLGFQKRGNGVFLHADLVHEKRQAGSSSAPAVTVCPSALPSYASRACPASSSFASACSCLRVTKRTTTATTPTATVTSIFTAPTQTITLPLTITTTLISIIPAPTIESFLIKANGQYVALRPEGGLFEMQLQQDRGPAETFSLEGTTVYNSNKTRIADTDGGTDVSFIYLDELAVYQSNNFPAISCSVGLYDTANAGYPLSCTSPGRGTFLTQDGNNRLALATNVPAGYGTAPQLYAVKP